MAPTRINGQQDYVIHTLARNGNTPRFHHANNEEPGVTKAYARPNGTRATEELGRRVVAYDCNTFRACSFFGTDFRPEASSYPNTVRT